MKKNLNKIYDNRTGGSINLIGISYQVYYSCYLLLKELNNNDKNKIRFEGIEDVDLFSYKANLESLDNISYIQLKHSDNKTDASHFWTKGILQNFIEVFLQDEKSKFKLVHDNKLAENNLDVLIKKDFSNKNKVDYWLKKIEEFKKDDKTQKWNWVNFDFQKFVSRIEFEYLTEEDLKKQIIKLLVDKYDITTGNENQYFMSLYFNIIHWAKNRENWIDSKKLNEVIGSTKADISLGTVNYAVKNKWIEKIDFFRIIETQDSNYYEGIPAKPEHILQKLPVERTQYIDIIQKSITDFSATVIKAASGQGKSTLAWQICESLKSEYEIYQLNWFNDEKEAGDLISFVESRLKVGKCVLLIIDGLASNTSKWSYLVNKLPARFVKYLITTREEDWYSYAGDNRGISLNVIDIYLDIKEAEQIYNKLKSINKIDVNVNNWQSAWEKLGDRKLILEYIYLLTKGDMLTVLLEQQLKELSNNNENSRAKAELLRLVSTADLMNVKIKAKDIVKYIDNRFRLSIDQAAFVKGLEKEYFLLFNNIYIEGLHSIRSEFISNILHNEYIGVEETIETLIDFIDDDFIHDFCLKLPIFIGKIESKNKIYCKLADHFIIKNYSEITKSVEGLFIGSLEEFWDENKKIFDKYSNKSGYITILAADSNPWTNSNLIADLVEKFMDMNPELLDVQKALADIKKFNIKKSDVYIYSDILNSKLSNIDIKENINGLGELSILLHKFEIKPFLNKKIDYQNLLDFILSLNISESKKIALAAYLTSPDLYKLYANCNLDKLLEFFKSNLDIAKVTIEDDCVNLSYLFNENKADVNQESVERITTIYHFLPFYNFYCSNIIAPDFIKHLGFYEYTVQEANKRMPNRNVEMGINTDINKAWFDFINSKYETSSIYDWQMFWYEFRKEAVSISKLMISILEHALEGNVQKALQSYNIFTQNGQILVSKNLRCNIFPHEDRPLKNTLPLKEDIKNLTSYFHILTNIISQFSKIFDNEFNGVNSNFNDLIQKLSLMQKSFKNIENQTSTYIDRFEMPKLIEDEINTYIRLYKTAVYYYKNYDMRGKCSNLKFSINRDYNQDIKNEQTKIYQILEVAAIHFELEIIPPNKVLEIDSLRYLILGIKNIDMQNIGKNILKILEILYDCRELEVHFFHVFFIKDNKATNGIRINKDKLISNFNNNFIDNNLIYPSMPDENLLSVFDNIKIQEVKESPQGNKFQTLLQIWKLKQQQIYSMVKNEEIIVRLKEIAESTMVTYFSYEKINHLVENIENEFELELCSILNDNNII